MGHENKPIRSCLKRVINNLAYFPSTDEHLAHYLAINNEVKGNEQEGAYHYCQSLEKTRLAPLMNCE